MRTIAAPVPVKERIVLLDVLRGMAIFGILMVNMQLFIKPMSHMLLGFQESAPLAERLSVIFIKFFFEGKFYVLFSLLFGYGAYLFMHKSTAEGISILPFYRRRMFFLLIFGILHVVLLWPGDILVFYALFGFLLLAFRKVSDKGLLKWAVWLMIIPPLITALFTLVISLMLKIPEASQAMEANLEGSAGVLQGIADKAFSAYTGGSYGEMVRMRLYEYQVLLPGVLFFYPVVLAMFLLGHLAARKGLMRDPGANLPFFRKTAAWGAGIGFPMSLLFVFTYMNMSTSQLDIYQVFNLLAMAFGGVSLGIFYLSMVVILVSKGNLKTFSHWLAPVGRMALTNYLLQSIICTTIFYAYGFGLMGKFNTFQGILLTILIFALQIPFSHFWLKHFHYGPFEWLWRSLTYMKIQPFRKKQ